MRHLFRCTMLCAAGLCFTAGAVTTSLTITGSGSSSLVSGTLYNISATGAATLTGFPNSTFTASGSVDTSNSPVNNAPITGPFTFDFGSGNRITGTFTAPAGSIALNLTAGQVATVPGSAVITGGTGIYAGATGSFPSLVGTGTVTSPTSSTFTITGNGTINLPAPTVPISGPLFLGLTALALLVSAWLFGNRLRPVDPTC